MESICQVSAGFLDISFDVSFTGDFIHEVSGFSFRCSLVVKVPLGKHTEEAWMKTRHVLLLGREHFRLLEK